jgi:hypothetical protein
MRQRPEDEEERDLKGIISYHLTGWDKGQKGDKFRDNTIKIYF